MIESIEIIEWVNQKKARPSLSPENFLQNIGPLQERSYVG